MNKDEILINLSENFTKIIPRSELLKYPSVNYGNNGIGDRLSKKLNYTVIYSTGKTKLYSNNDNDFIHELLLNNFLKNNNEKNKGIIGFYIHSVRDTNYSRNINKAIITTINKKSCVVCGSNNNIICDHKNDLYNDIRVLSTNTQLINDFQPLCNHCNLQKRQIAKKEKENNKLYSAKNIPMYKIFNFEFPWEKKSFDITDITCKIDTFWYDPIEFNNKLMMYQLYVYPILQEIKKKIKLIS